MNTNNLSGLSPLWLISLAMVLGTTIVVMIPFGITGGDGIKASDWISFAGNVLAGVMTLIAAITAWFAVQRQIDLNRELAGQSASQAEAAIREELVPLLQALDELWRILDDITLLPVRDRVTRMVWLSGTMFRLPPPTILDDLKRYGAKLDVDRLPRFGRLMVHLQMVYRSTINVGEMDAKIAIKTNQTNILKAQLESLRFVAIEFAPTWAAAAFKHHSSIGLPTAFSYADAIRADYEFMAHEEAWNSEDDDAHGGKTM